MNEFRFLLKNEKAAAYHRISVIIILINALVFLYLGFYSTEAKLRNISLATVGLLAASLLLNIYLKRIEAGWKVGLDAMFFFLMIAWGLTKFYWVSLVPAVLGGMAIISMRKMEVVITKHAIRYPSFPVRNIGWNEVNNVILKDGLLTIDLKNNKLIQQYVGDQINERDFNEFCQVHRKPV